MNAPFKPEPIVPILADVGVSISDLKRNPAAAIQAAHSQQVAILSRNKPVAYLISPDVWDHILDVFDERKFVRTYESRMDDVDKAVAVSLDDL